MRTCPHCRSEIAWMADKCPYCHEDPKEENKIFNAIFSAILIGGIAFLALGWLL